MESINSSDFVSTFSVKQALSRSDGSETFLVCRNYDDALFVAKSFEKSKISDIQNFVLVLNMIKKANFHFIAEYFAIVDSPTKIILIRKYLSKYEEFSKTIQIPNRNITTIWRHIFQNFSILHDNGIGPNVIKPSNIFITDNDNIVLTDVYPFPSTQFTAAATPENSKMLFLAPEYFTGEFPVSIKSDIWSLGALMLCSYGFEIPWSTSNVFAMIKMITVPKIDLPEDVPAELREILMKMLIKDPTVRSPLRKLIRAHSRSNGAQQWGLVIKPKVQQNTNPSVNAVGSVLNVAMPVFNPSKKLSKLNINSNVRSAKLPPLPNNLIAGIYPMIDRKPRMRSFTARVSATQIENRKLVDQMLNFS